MTKRKLAPLAVLTAAILTLATGCGVKNVDVGQTRAELVQGTSNLYRFCDGETLIYFSKRSGGNDDEYEWFYPGGCTAEPPKVVPNGDSTEDGT